MDHRLFVNSILPNLPLADIDSSKNDLVLYILAINPRSPTARDILRSWKLVVRGEEKEGYHTGRKGGRNHVTLIPRVLRENSNVLERRNPPSRYGGKGPPAHPSFEKEEAAIA